MFPYVKLIRKGNERALQVGKEVQGIELLWHIKLAMLWKFLQKCILASSAKSIILKYREGRKDRGVFWSIQHCANCLKINVVEYGKNA